MPKSKNKLVNLLPQEEFDASIVGRVLKWAMGTFRIIVIVTEMIVMGAFLSRFWLDARNSDLNELIDIKSAQVMAQSDFEQEFRSIQARLKIFDDMDKNRKASETLTKITSKTPSDISLSTVSFQDELAQVKGVATSELSIAQFVANLSADDFFKEVSLGQVSQSEDNPSLTIFTISITY
jgi:Tfp pilus assembly protein PilN